MAFNTYSFYFDLSLPQDCQWLDTWQQLHHGTCITAQSLPPDCQWLDSWLECLIFYLSNKLYCSKVCSISRIPDIDTVSKVSIKTLINKLFKLNI